MAVLALHPSFLFAGDLTASDRAADYDFGYSVSQSGSVALVGAPHVVFANIKGSAYLFRDSNSDTGSLVQAAKLSALGGNSIDYVGFSVSLSGGIAIAGSPTDGTKGSFAGAAFIFRGLETASGPVSESLKLIASDGAANDYFGYSVSQSSNVGLVGAYLNDDKGTDSGSAYVFRGLNTATGSITQNVKLTPSDGASGNFFGYSVSLSGSIGLVGAYLSFNNKGSAYVFRGLDTATGSITQQARLVASDGAASDLFGRAVSQSGSVALVGAHGDDDKGSNSGAAYVFRGLDTAIGSVTESVKLVASDGAADDSFGFSVSQSGNIGLVGSYQDDDKGSNSGSAYLFRGLNVVGGLITEGVKLTASDGAANDYFGYSVSLDGDQFLVGAYGKDNLAGKA